MNLTEMNFLMLSDSVEPSAVASAGNFAKLIEIVVNAGMAGWAGQASWMFGGARCGSCSIIQLKQSHLRAVVVHSRTLKHI